MNWAACIYGNGEKWNKSISHFVIAMLSLQSGRSGDGSLVMSQSLALRNPFPTCGLASIVTAVGLYHQYDERLGEWRFAWRRSVDVCPGRKGGR